MDDLQKNPYFDKYADKIAKMQKYAANAQLSFKTKDLPR